MLGLYVLYAAVGLLLLLAALGGGDPGSLNDRHSPTGLAAKAVAAGSGLAYVALGLGLYLFAEPTANPTAAQALTLGGAALGLGLMVYSWKLIARDLRKRRR